MNTPLYDIHGIRHGYNRKFLLDIPHLAIDAGESLGITGANGSGKSTLLRILSFLEQPEAGNIRYDGVPVTTANASSFREVTLLIQEPYLLKRPVFENVAYGLRVRGETGNLRERVHEALRWVGLAPSEFAGRKWFELSGGEAKRVALAARLVLLPRVLILDEPTANIDRQSASSIKEAIARLRERHTLTLVIASHDTPWLRDVTGALMNMREGKLRPHESENIIPGPWLAGSDGLWKKTLPDSQVISATQPPDENSKAVLSASSIIISLTEPDRVSAQNRLRGAIASMTFDRESGAIRVEVDAGGSIFLSTVTAHAAEALKLLPGTGVWIVFKASSLSWE